MKREIWVCDRCGFQMTSESTCASVLGKDLCIRCVQSFWAWFHDGQAERAPEVPRRPPEEPAEARGAKTVTEWSLLAGASRGYVSGWMQEKGIVPVPGYKRPFFNKAGRVSRAPVYRLSPWQETELRKNAERLNKDKGGN